MNCFFCQTPLAPEDQHCIANDVCRKAGVRHIIRTYDMHDDPIEPRHHIIEFFGTVKGRTYLVTYSVDPMNDFFQNSECDVAEKVACEDDPEEWTYKDTIKLPYPPVSITPQNFKDKFPLLLLLS